MNKIELKQGVGVDGPLALKEIVKVVNKQTKAYFSKRVHAQTIVWISSS